MHSLSKNWVILPKKSDSIIEQLLFNRNIKLKNRKSFLSPSFDQDLHDPFLMKGMKAAIGRIIKAIDNKEKIGLFGDYDADGIPGLALLYQSFKKMGLEVILYIPKRAQGYGLNFEGIDLFKKEKVTLMVTVDLGIRNIKEVIYAKENGIDTIIIDHHEQGEKLPEAIILNPKQKNDRYPFRELSACGVAFKFIQGMSRESMLTKTINIPFLKWLLDLVAIATICDVVPLVDENRIFAKFGLIVLQKTRRIGLEKLYQAATIDHNLIDTHTVGFQIGPRLNAPGRMDHANESFYLLVSEDPRESMILATKLDQINRQRQAELERVLKEAEEKVEKNLLHQKKVILVEGKNWPHGIIGLVAGKLMEQFSRPAIVCERREKDFRGSARSIDAFNIIEALEEAKQFLSSYGGHAKAAGLTFEQEHLSNLYDELLKIAENKITNEDLIPKLKIDALVKKEDLDYNLLNDIQKFAPFGLGNPRPVFMIEKAAISDIRTVGQTQKHLKMKVEGIEAIGFDLGNLAKDLSQDQKIDAAFTLDEDNWDGNKKLQLKIIDIRI